MDKPTCKRCGEQHFNFVACEQRPEFEAREAEAAAEEQKRNTMSRNDWARNEFTGPKLRNYVAIAPNVFMRKK